MKILFIHNKYKQYGGEDVAVELETSVLKEKGHDVKTIFFDNKPINGFFAKLSAAFNAIYNFSSSRRLSKIIVQFRPDIIHIHNLFFVASPSVIYAAVKHKVPVILTLHNYRLICSNALLLRQNKICELCIHKTFPLYGIRYRCYRNSRTASGLVTAITGIHKVLGTWKNKVTAFIVSNEFSRSRLINSSLNLPENKMLVKSNFVADPGNGNEQRDDFFLFAGRLAPEKGVHILLEAFARLPSRQIMIIGDGPEGEFLQKKYSACSNIHFAGKKDREEVIDTMKRCKAFICTSIWYEFTPFTIFEAFATGTPVIASKAGSMTDSISHGYNGLHFKLGDADDLVQKVELFLQQTKDNSDYYNNARLTYLEKYHPEVYYRSIIKIYDAAIAEFK